MQATARADTSGQTDSQAFEKVLAQIREHFGERVFPLTVPLNPGPGFNQVLDVPRSEVITFAGAKSGKFTKAPASGLPRLTG